MKLHIDVNDDTNSQQDEEERVSAIEGNYGEVNPSVPPSNKYERSFKSLAEEELKEAAGEAMGQV